MTPNQKKIRVYTNGRYAGQTLNVPVVGEITLDQDSSVELDEEAGLALIEASKGSLEFYTKQELKQQQQAAKQTKVTKNAGKGKQEEKGSESSTDDALVEAIETASLDELKELLPLVDGAEQKDIEGKTEQEIKAFLLSKIAK